MSPQHHLFEPQKAMTYSDLWRAIRQGWPFILGLAIIGFILSITILRVIEPKHTITLVVGPSAHNSATSRGANIRLDNRADMSVRIATVDSNSQENLTDFARFMELITSPETLKNLYQNPQTRHLVYLTAGMTQNKNTQQWEKPQNIKTTLYNILKSLAGQNVTDQALSILDIAQQLRRSIRVEAIGSSPMRRLIFRHANPQFASTLLTALVEQSDNAIQKSEATRTNVEIDYLRTALNQETISEHRRLLAGMLASQEQRAMMISVDLPFAAEIIQPAFSTKHPDWPPVGLVLLIGTFIGTLAGVYIASVKERLRMSIARH